MKRLKIFLIVLLITIVIASVAGFIYLKANTYQVDYTNDQFLENSTLSGNIRLFEPTGDVFANVVLYPGGLVERDAYAYLAYLLSLEGFRVFLVGMPLNLAILDVDRISAVMDAFPSDLAWYIGGHSLGGASASIYAAEKHHKIKGIFFLGAYPSSQSDLSQTGLKVISITTENDLILNQKTYEDTKVLLPNETIYVSIDGGNHSYFGYYGQQKNDGIAKISRELQHQQTVEALTNWIKT